MASWRAFPGSALGVMVEVYKHRSPTCAAIGHQPRWLTDQLVCGRKGCRMTFPKATRVLLDEFDTLEGHVMVADELRRRHVEGNTTSDDRGIW